MNEDSLRGSDEIENMLKMLASTPEKPMAAPWMFNDDAYFQAFENLTLPLDYWRQHRAHVRMAHAYVTRFGYKAGLERVRGAIQAFFNHNGIELTATTGYHETLTVTWMRIINHAVRSHGPEGDSILFCDRHPFLMSNTLSRMFYTTARLYSWEARKGWVEPDLMPLPAE